MVALLRSVALLDSEIYKVSDVVLPFDIKLTVHIPQKWDRVRKTVNTTNVQIRYKRSTVYDTTEDDESVVRPAKRVKTNLSGSKIGDERSEDGKHEEGGDLGADEEEMALDLGDLDVR